MTKIERERILARAAFLRELLKEFGCELAHFDPGVGAKILGKPANSCWGSNLWFDGPEWNWLEPLLVELKLFRETKRMSDKNDST